MYERRRLTPLCTVLLALLISVFAMIDAHAFFNNKVRAEDEVGGSVRAVINGTNSLFPRFKSDIFRQNRRRSGHCDHCSDLFLILQIGCLMRPICFPSTRMRLFPSCMMETGDERITAVIKKKAEARATYDKAKRSGKTAALLSQHRPNMFTQELANLMPGQPVKITLKYSMAVPRIDGLMSWWCRWSWGRVSCPSQSQRLVLLRMVKRMQRQKRRKAANGRLENCQPIRLLAA